MKLTTLEMEALLVLAEAAERGGPLAAYTQLADAERAPALAAAHRTVLEKLRLFHAHRKRQLG